MKSSTMKTSVVQLHDWVQKGDRAAKPLVSLFLCLRTLPCVVVGYPTICIRQSRANSSDITNDKKATIHRHRE